MRINPWILLAFIAVITAFSFWVVLPGDSLDVSGFKADHPVKEGLDLQGGVQVRLKAVPPEGSSVDGDSLEGTRNTIERRINELGVSEAVVQTRGDDEIIVEIPGAENPDEAIEVVQETALLEIIDTQGQSLPPGTIVTTTLGGPREDLDASASPEASPVAAASPLAGASPVAAASPVPADIDTASSETVTGPVYETIISGDELSDAYRTSGNFGEPVVGFELSGSAADRFFDYTSTHIGQSMSIVIDKVVISSPRIDGAISNQGVIEGVEDVNNLVAQLKAGSLELPLEVVQSRTVGPSLGQDSIDKSIIAGLIGLSTVALFMVLYYRLPGLLSVGALLIYATIMFALFKLIPVTLTLAGIAAFILSIGMAVDANVLIFARLKEELRTGKSVSQAVDAGFAHAWPSIRDSNITTMITAIILWMFGRYTGATIITGFAVTLLIGVIVSMFTAITVTRTFLQLALGSDRIHDRWWFGVERTIPSTSVAADQLP